MKTKDCVFQLHSTHTLYTIFTELFSLIVNLQRYLKVD